MDIIDLVGLKYVSDKVTRIIRDLDLSNLDYLARNTKSDNMLEAIANNTNNEDVLRTVAYNKHCSTDTIELLIYKVKLPATMREIILKLDEHKIAKRTYLELYRKSALHASVRGELARSLSTPYFILKKLVDDPSFTVSTFLASNPNMEEPELHKLMESDNPSIRMSVMKNKSLSSSFLEEYMNDPEDLVKSEIANHPRITKKIINTYLKNHSMLIDKGLLSNDRVPESIKMTIRKRQGMGFVATPNRRKAGKFNSHDLYLLYLKVKGKGYFTDLELKRDPLYNTKDVQAFLKNHRKKFNALDIVKFDIDIQSNDSEVMTFLKKHTKVARSVWKGAQRIFKNRPNFVMQLNLPESYIDALIDMTNLTTENQMYLSSLKKSNHPVSDKDYTVGWVRYSVFDTYVWIDEVQTDWFKIKDENFKMQLKGLPDYLLHRFVQLVHKIYGVSKIYLPTIELKKSEYLATTLPKYALELYNDGAKKARFKKTDTYSEGIDYIEESKPVWVLNANFQALFI